MFIWVWISLFMQFFDLPLCNCETFPYKVVINNHSVTIEGNLIFFNCSQGFTQNFGLPKYWIKKIPKSWNKMWQPASVYRTTIFFSQCIFTFFAAYKFLFLMLKKNYRYSFRWHCQVDEVNHKVLSLCTLHPPICWKRR